MMDLSILVFFQSWMISSKNEMNSHDMSDRNDEGSLTGHPPVITRGR
ncbi:MAG TPA: hypothetical protein PLM07_17385 [Candidatus Rifleibacterium sp.]|nr:hypothetical protein [Candidatus Rifleibacterium sp.]HPT47655.1 hypothetical protein [Candidatus Rifleibacterium sp.]